MQYKVYLIENSVNHKKYVGYTSQSLSKRFNQHSRSNKPIGKAIRKYGKSSFTICQIDECDDILSVLDCERKWVLHHKAFEDGYNCTIGGDCSPVTRKTDPYKTEDFRNKVRKNAICQHADPTKKKTHVEGIQNYWKSLTEDQKNRRREIAVKNGKQSVTAWNKGLRFPGTGLHGENNPMSKQYRVWFPDGSEAIIKCLSSFCKKNGLTYRNACGVLEGKQRHHKGFRFARLETHT